MITKFIKCKQLYSLIVGLCLFAFHTQAQNTWETFGKNRVQYKNFEWKLLTTTNFEIYYYQGGNEIANFAARYAESDFDRIADILGYTPYSKTKIFIYNSITDLQQSNAGLEDDTYVIGGQTNFIKSRVEIPYPGDQAGFKKELSLGIARMFIMEMMFGGSLRDMVQSSYLLTLPDWFMSGAAAYVAEGWSVEMDDYIRDAALNKNLRRPSTLSGDRAVLIGQSIWNFIAERYGKSNISNILNLTRIIRNEESSITSTLGIPSYNQFLGEWRNYYTSMATTVASSYKLPEPDLIIKRNKRNKFLYNQLATSPDGKKIAYSQNYEGRYKVIVRNTDSKKSRWVMSGGSKVINQRIDEELPLLEWRNNNALAVVTVNKGEYYLYLLDLSKANTKKTRKSLESFTQVKSIDISDDGTAVVMSAVRNGRNDVYIFDLNRNSIRQITNDIYDDKEPKFLSNSTTAFVFSSNRNTDSLSTGKTGFQILDNNFDLYVFNPNQSTTILQRLTNSAGDESQPVVAGDSAVFFLSNENGIDQLHKFNLTTNSVSQVTGFQQGLQAYAVNLSTNSLAYMLTRNGRNYIGLDKDFNFNEQASAIRTRRSEIQEETAGGTPGRLSTIQPSSNAPRRDSTAAPVNSSDSRLALEEGEVDTDNYQFDIDVKKQREESENRSRRTLLNPPIAANARRQNVSVQGPFPYKSRFSADNIISSVLIDPLRGLGVLFTINMNDILEDHKIYGGVLAITDLRSSNFFGEYQYLKHQIDFGVRFDKKTIFVNSSSIFQRYNLNKLQFPVSYPFSVSSRVTVAPFLANARFTNTIGNPLYIGGAGVLPDANTLYGGVRAEYVFDNTTINGLNMIEGTRMKIRYENYMAANTPNESFDNLSIDLRNYQKIHRDIIFATRLAYGVFGGKARRNYVMGGMDNWIFNQRDNQGRGDLLAYYDYAADRRDQLFMEFVTPLRGFNYNKLFGNNFGLFNAEFRFPIVKYFYRGPITSNFFKNLQLVAFTDIGAAWTGKGPFSRQNSLNTRIEGGDNNPFRATVTNFKNPFLSGHGAGIRTLLLGYYLKFDVAWGVEDFVVSGPKYYLTFGYDF